MCIRDSNQPVINHPSFGKIKLMSHDHFALLETKNFEPMKLFFEPITRGLNYLDSYFDYNSYSMVGISGGGWTTTIFDWRFAILPAAIGSITCATLFFCFGKNWPADLDLKPYGAVRIFIPPQNTKDNPFINSFNNNKKNNN